MEIIISEIPGMRGVKVVQFEFSFGGGNGDWGREQVGVIYEEES